MSDDSDDDDGLLEVPPPPPPESEGQGPRWQEASVVSGIPPPPEESAGMRAAMGSPAVLRLLEDDVRLQGLVKGYNMAGGFGFIRCTKTWEIFGCDVFLHKFEAEAAGATASGACVTFGLRLGKEGKPQAVSVAMVAPAGAQKNAPNGRVYSGMIKSFNSEKGFGFISCEALQEAFGRDAFLHANQKRDFLTGDRVNFQIDTDAKGFPKARDLTEATGYGGEVEEGAGLPRKATRRTVSPGGTERAAPVKAENGDGDDAAGDGAAGDGVAGDGAAAGDDAAGDGAAGGCAEPGGQPTAEATAAADVAGGLPGAPPANRLPSSKVVWQKYALEDGSGHWWWCEADGSHFVEANPGAWQKFFDPDSEATYWWRDDTTWFWEHSGTT